jgi:sec-independent protein translocase protein TatC
VPIDQPNAGEMPFLDHLEELRWRIVKSLAALAVGFFVAFWLVYTFRNEAIALVVQPIMPLLPGGKLYYTNPFGAFSILMQVSGVLALVLASPVVGYQVWSFLSPALTSRERRVIVPVLWFAMLLFLAGVALAVFVFLPVTAKFMISVQSDALAPLITAESYFGMLLFTGLAFGAVFELPILALILTALGLITPATLTRIRRWAMVISLVVCMVITPGDMVMATLLLWLPVYGLYELSIVVSWFVQRARRRRDALGEAAGAGVAD